ncbi:MAG: hypothetical protein GX801_08530 [Fibrobacter sp.]|nr:hypothetical protein [Fibrobacter sp.]
MEKLQLGLIVCDNKLPIHHSKEIYADSAGIDILARALLVYGDSTHLEFTVEIQEYSSDLDAYGAFLRHGLPQDGMPRIIGELQESWYHESQWLISFKSNRLRPLSRNSQEKLIESFFRSERKLLQVFTLLPLLERQVNGSAIIENSLLGYDINAKFLTQHYCDSLGAWYAALSVEKVLADAIADWLKEIDPKVDFHENSVVNIKTQGYNIIAGSVNERLVVVWAKRNVFLIKKQWEKVAKSSQGKG